MRPKLKPDVFWVPGPEGVSFVHSGGHLNINGKTAFALIDRLAPFLDGSTSLDELVGDLPGGKQEMVTTLVTALARAGLVKDTTEDLPHTLDASLLDTYAAEIAYIDYYLDSAARRFQKYRETPVVCVGSGLTFTALIHACLRSGLREIVAVVTEESPTDLNRLREYADEATARDPHQRLTLRQASPDQDWPDVVWEGELVLHVADVNVPARARRLDLLCRELGRPLVQAVVVADEAWIGPVGGSAGPGWESTWLRRAEGTAEDASAGGFLAGPTAGIVANRLSFLAFRHVTGVEEIDPVVADPTGAGRRLITRVDLETLATTAHRCHPHPGGLDAAPDTESAFADRYEAFLAARARGSDDFSAAAATLYDPRLGLFTELDEHALPQIPLRVVKARVADPFGVLGAASEVLGAGPSLERARRGCGEVALRAYAALAVDGRRLVEDDGALKAYAYNLQLGKPELVEAHLAYPALAAPLSPEGFRVPPGLVSGTDAGDALTRGLLWHCVERTVAGLNKAAEPYPLVDLAAVLPEADRQILEILRLIGADTAVYDVTGELGVRVYAVCDGGRAVAYVPGDDLISGLEQVVLGRQGVTEPAVPDLPRALRGTGTALAAEPYTPPPWPELVEILHSRGARVYALPAGHDPVVTAALPTLVQVVVHD
ncbi:hypothetical protein [Rhizohabitans arisaemae]|uniref:hypothetical protein n=1 Tax=Rhizohabitans arisaemae TaxID=2720610 RepID=UPI0024B26EA6|nr:hypothetical protein [Rhizohabitans arisaemae]